MKNDVVEELFARYYNDALLYTLSLSRNRAVSEDVVSDAFYKALKTSDGSVENFKAWLLTVCRNTYYNHVRREKKHTHMSDEIADGDSVIEKVLQDESYQALYRAVDMLPEHQREVLTLFYFEGLKLGEIAEIVSKTEINVRVILCRARENVKKILEVKK